MARDLLDALYGCLVGGAVGDAMGAPVEGWYRADILAKHGKVDRFLQFDSGYAQGPGHVTDDTYLSQLLCYCIAEKGGRITPDDLARTLADKARLDRLWTNERLMMIKIKQGMNPWWETGRGNIPAGCASMCIEPVGIINAGDPDQAYEDAFCIASINQDGNNRDFAATLAAGVAAAFAPGASTKSVIKAMLDHSDWLTRRALTMVMEMATESPDVDAFAERFYASPMFDWSWPAGKWRREHYFSGNSIEFVSAAVALVHLCGDDVNRCIVEGASFGRDCDSIASICGNIAGALHGASSIRPEWVEACEKANQDIFEELWGDPGFGFRRVAERLREALGGEQRRLAGRAESVARVLRS